MSEGVVVKKFFISTYTSQAIRIRTRLRQDYGEANPAFVKTMAGKEKYANTGKKKKR